MMHSINGRRFRLPAGATVLLLFLLSGCGALSGSPSANTDAEQTATSSAESPTVPSAVPGTSSNAMGAEPAKDVPAEGASTIGESQPVSLSIPALDRQSDIIETGLRDDDTLEVPPGYEGAPASWYSGSPTPGELGPSVLLGHVNSTEDASGVFYNLDTLEQGDQVSITRKDGSTVTFEVYKSEVYPKTNFPTRAVYQSTDRAELRLITCDGFTESSGEFVDNLVVYAKLVGTT